MVEDIYLKTSAYSYPVECHQSTAPEEEGALHVQATGVNPFLKSAVWKFRCCL